VTDPSERITLSLKARIGAGAAPKPAAPPARPSAPLPPGIDSAVLAELKAAVLTFEYLRGFDEPIEFWEAVRLARAGRGVSPAVTEEDESAQPMDDSGMADELQAIRRQLSPMVRDLRRFLVHVPDLPPPGEPLEIALGFLLASSKEHRLVAKWLAESNQHLDKAASKLRSLATIAVPYLEVLRPWTLGPPAPAAAPTPVAASAPAPKQPAPPVPGPAPAAAPAIDADILDNLRRAVLSRQVFLETQLNTGFWEALLLNSIERIPSGARLTRILQARKDKQLAVFHEEARNLHARILPLRARHGRWVQALGDYLRSLPESPEDPDQFELTLSFAVVEPGSQERTGRWLSAPEAHAREASALIAALTAKSKAYLAAVKKPEA
jgi:hypothetical protein